MSSAPPLANAPAPPCDPRDRLHLAAHIAELDGVRGIAVLLVIVYHAFFWSMNDAGSLAAWSWPARLLANLTRPGWLGVDLFFVLSGFLITGILLQTRTSPHFYRNFYGRRALRILPLYYLLLLALWALYPGSGRFVLLAFVYLANVTPLFGVAGLYAPLWSLAVEEHFYLVWPFIVRVASTRALWAIAIGLCVGEPALRVIGFLRDSDTYSYTWFRLDGLAYGALLALYLRHPLWVTPTRPRLRRIALLALGAGLALLIIGAPLGILTRKQLLGATLQYTAAQWVFTGFLALVLASAGARLTAPLRLPALRRVGDWSYFLYLVHVLLFELYDRALLRLAFAPGTSPFGAILLRAGVVFAASCLLAELSLRYYETPILSLKRHLRYES